jgi:hypothetical protein
MIIYGEGLRVTGIFLLSQTINRVMIRKIAIIRVISSPSQSAAKMKVKKV